MENISYPILFLFILCTLFAAWQLYKATHYSKITLLILLVWASIQAAIGFTDFYRVQSIPPRFPLLIIPPLLVIFLLFITKKGRTFIDSLDIKPLTILHTVRIAVEICLYALFVAKLIPEIMTFEGYNLDILSGISAPIVYYFVFLKSTNKKWLLAWNIICLLLLINIVTIAILSAQTPLQQLAFDQPNLGVTYFPFVWLPSVIVPIVLLSHLTSIRNLIKNK